jgi:hypothetical protein
MKRLIALLLLICLLPFAALAEEEKQIIFDRTKNLTEEYVFPEGTPVLEIVFPRVYSSDCAIIRFGDETMMIDASTLNKKMKARIRTAIQSMGVDHIDVAFNSHPHDDHIDGFPTVDSYCPIGKMILTFEEDYDKHMKDVVKYCNEQEIPIEHVGDGDVLTMGENGEVTMRVIQRNDRQQNVGEGALGLVLIDHHQGGGGGCGGGDGTEDQAGGHGQLVAEEQVQQKQSAVHQKSGCQRLQNGDDGGLPAGAPQGRDPELTADGKSDKAQGGIRQKTQRFHHFKRFKAQARHFEAAQNQRAYQKTCDQIAGNVRQIPTGSQSGQKQTGKHGTADCQ